MARTVVIADRSKTMRKILSGIVLANLNDVTVLEATDENEVAALLEKHDCHLVIYNWDMASSEYISLVAALKDRGMPLLFLLSSGNPQQVDNVLANGISRDCMAPLQADALIEAINRLCNPLTLRKSKRYNIAGSHAKIFQQEHCFHAAVINVSLGGMLCDLEYSPDYHWAQSTRIVINFPKEERARETSGIISAVSRLHVSESNPDHSPALLRVAFRFMEVPEESRKILEEVFSQADEEESLVLQG